MGELLKVPYSDDNGEPEGWYIIEVERVAGTTNKHTIKFINKRYEHISPWPWFETVVPNYNSLPMEDLIKHPNLVNLDSIEEKYFLVAYDYDYDEPSHVWTLSIKDAFLLKRELEALYPDEKHTFSIKKKSTGKTLPDALEEFEQFIGNTT
jgi:hypothetical protein